MSTCLILKTIQFNKKNYKVTLNKQTKLVIYTLHKKSDLGKLSSNIINSFRRKLKFI